MNDIFNRSELLLGSAVMEALRQKRVLLVGVGGVGSWCAESLIRTGLTHLTIVDCDRVCETNINRQLMATTLTVGLYKVDVLRERLLTINPEADIVALREVYSPDSRELFHLDDYDYIIDCIDSLKDKIDLLIKATRQPRATVFSSMGAALKLDPTRIAVTEFWKVKGCPLGAAMRSRMRKEKLFPKKKILCVYSEELLQNLGEPLADDKSPEIFHKVSTNGSLSHITGIYGFTLAGLVISDLAKKCK